jgi:hypothetical protein
MEEGEIEVDSIEPIGFLDITPELARDSGFLGVLDLLKVAKHGRGEKIYLVCFHYIPPSETKPNLLLSSLHPCMRRRLQWRFFLKARRGCAILVTFLFWSQGWDCTNVCIPRKPSPVLITPPESAQSQMSAAPTVPSQPSVPSAPSPSAGNTWPADCFQ